MTCTRMICTAIAASTYERERERWWGYPILGSEISCGVHVHMCAELSSVVKYCVAYAWYMLVRAAGHSF